MKEDYMQEQNNSIQQEDDEEEKINPFISIISEMFDSYEEFSLETYQSRIDNSFVLHIFRHNRLSFCFCRYINIL